VFYGWKGNIKAGIIFVVLLLWLWSASSTPLDSVYKKFDDNVSTLASEANVKVSSHLDRFEQAIYNSAGDEITIVYANNASDLVQLTGQKGVIYPDPTINEVSIQNGKAAQKTFWGINTSRSGVIVSYHELCMAPGFAYVLANKSQSGVIFEHGPEQTTELPILVLFFAIVFFFLGLIPGFWSSGSCYDDY